MKILILGERGEGKSKLAAFLKQPLQIFMRQNPELVAADAPPLYQQKAGTRSIVVYSGVDEEVAVSGHEEYEHRVSEPLDKTALDNSYTISLENGKYRVTNANGNITIKRHGVKWRDKTGDSFILALVQHIETLETTVTLG